MRVAIGLKAHSGWAAAVVIGASGNEFQLIDRRRIELVEEKDLSWAKQPYHAAEELDHKNAEVLVRHSIQSAHRIAVREMQDEVKRLRQNGNQIAACAVLTPAPMPAWSVAEILAVHIRMHMAEGVLFPEALANAAVECGLDLVQIPEKLLTEQAEAALGPIGAIDQLAALGKAAGPPWGKDQKTAALAAAIALHRQP